MWELDSKGTTHVWGQGVYGNSLYFTLNFVVKRKLLIKIKTAN